MKNKDAILLFLSGKDWEFSGVIADRVREITKSKASTIERRCREMASPSEGEPLLERKLVHIDNTGPYIVKYRINPTLVPAKDQAPLF